MNHSDRYTILGLEFCSKPLYNLQVPELIIAYRANYITYYMTGFYENWKLFRSRLHFCIDPMSFDLIESNGYQLVFETPNSVSWHLLLLNDRIIRACIDSLQYATMSDEELIGVLVSFKGPPVVREAMMFYIDKDRLAVLEHQVWWRRERPDFLAWLEGLD